MIGNPKHDEVRNRSRSKHAARLTTLGSTRACVPFRRAASSDLLRARVSCSSFRVDDGPTRPGGRSAAGNRSKRRRPNLGRPVDFEKDVAPILEANCLACHNSAISESKLSVETAESRSARGANAARLSYRRIPRPACCFKWPRGPSSPPCRRFPIRSKPTPFRPRNWAS